MLKVRQIRIAEFITKVVATRRWDVLITTFGKWIKSKRSLQIEQNSEISGLNGTPTTRLNFPLLLSWSWMLKEGNFSFFASNYLKSVFGRLYSWRKMLPTESLMWSQTSWCPVPCNTSIICTSTGQCELLLFFTLLWSYLIFVLFSTASGALGEVPFTDIYILHST